MTLTAIILLIILGFILVLFEIFLLPGFIVGIMGIALMIIGIVMAYSYGATVGNYVLLGTVFGTALLTYLAFKNNTWRKVTLHSSIKGKVNTLEEKLINVGDRGVAVSRLAPMGKALIQNNIFEVQSLEGYINENSEIVVVKIESNKILVKRKNP